MKQLFTYLSFLLIATSAFAQAPNAINYQGVARGANGDVFVNQQITPRFTIHKDSVDGFVVYDEDHASPGPIITTNEKGLFTAEVGKGYRINGSPEFSAIDWSDGPFFLEVGLDTTGAFNYQTIGTQELLSVPFALHAQTADSLSTPLTGGNNINVTSGYVINEVTNIQPSRAIQFIICTSGAYPASSTSSSLDNATLGEVRMFAGNFAPGGWAFCDGQLLSVANNAALFSILGTTYGGNGSSNFALPDLRGRAPIHEGTGPGLTPRSLGVGYGAE